MGIWYSGGLERTANYESRPVLKPGIVTLGLRPELRRALLLHARSFALRVRLQNSGVPGRQDLEYLLSW